MITQLNAANLPSNEEWKFDQEKSEHELVKLVVLHELPFSLVEYKKFRSFISSLNPWFQHMSRTTIKKYCLLAYEEERVEIHDVIERLDSRVSLTADLWTSNQNLGYLCVTLHIIDDGWRLHKLIIKFASVETPHDGPNLFNAMLTTLQAWNIEKKVLFITLDNATTNDSFVESLRKNLLGKSLLLHNGKLLHYRCAAHVLNLIAQEGFKFLKGAIDNIRESVKYIKSSPARKERFEKIVHRVGISCAHRPSLDASTRWNSTYEMLISAAEYMRAFEGLAKEDPQYIYEPSVKDWILSQKLCNMLKVFRDATKVVSGSQYPTINLYFHQMWEVKKMLEKEGSSSEPVIVSMVNEMKKKFKKYWDLSFVNICLPVIVDPRFKLAFLEFRLKKGFENMAATYLFQIELSFHELFHEYSLQAVDCQSKNAESDVKVAETIDNDDPWADWEEVQNVQQMRTTSELEEYLSKETVPVGASLNILEHWKVHSTKYPILARMARDILAIPASTVASESAFSTGERVISDYRSSLKSDTVEALICLQDWIRVKDRKKCNVAGMFDDYDDNDMKLPL
ncbi:hypothetical protein QOZ80_3BG0266230 [Eleusine coracana subsp. coracana]|nr:hypothetical protein QOZ80_3BG0266230 [Eleusine coracana subsp. coracana]